ncbi:hypothetical protein BGW41_007873 [Actinomortierella wolfii]|nr:hypothetical protein BGW41_007873 [Actinomortierella wolfii]
MIYGHSLGTGISANLCRKLEEQGVVPLAMILDAAFTSMPDMMTAYRKIPIVRPFARFPLLINHFKQKLLDRFETVRAVESIRTPLLLIHGAEDADVLISNSHTLFHTALTARRLQTCTKELSVTEAGESKEAEEELARAGVDLGFRDSLTTAMKSPLSDPTDSLLFRGARAATHPRGTDTASQTLDQEQQSDQDCNDDIARNEPKELSRPSSPLSSSNDSGFGSGLTSPGNSGSSSTQEGVKGKGLPEDKKNNKDETLSTLDDTHPSHQYGHRNNPQGKTGKSDAHGDIYYGSCHTVQLEFPREGSFEYNEQFQIGFLTVQFAVHNNCGEFEITREVLGLFIEAVERRRAWLREQQMVTSSSEKLQTQEENSGDDGKEAAEPKGLESGYDEKIRKLKGTGSRRASLLFDMVQALRANRVGAEQLDVPEVVE